MLPSSSSTRSPPISTRAAGAKKTAGEQALGRSRGGYSTKLHAAGDARGSPLALADASRHGRALIDRALYLPEVWSEDQDRRAEAGIPGEVRFLTKPKLGLAMLEGAHAAGVPFAPRLPAAAALAETDRPQATADSIYGADHVLRRWLQEQRLGYVLAVTKAQRLGFGSRIGSARCRRKAGIA